jgi:hypothetical protein
MSHHDAQVVTQLQAQLQVAAAERAGLAAQAEAVASAHADLTQQVSQTPCWWGGALTCSTRAAPWKMLHATHIH